MLDLSLRQDNEIKVQAKVYLIELKDQEVIEFAMTLFPVRTKQDPIDLIYNNMLNYYKLRLDKRIKFDAITEEVKQKAREKGQRTHEAAICLFRSPFKQKFQAKIMKTQKGGSKEVSKVEIDLDKTEDQTDRKEITFERQPQIQKPKNKSAKPIRESGGFTSMHDSSSPKRKATIGSSNKEPTVHKRIKKNLNLSLETNNPFLKSTIVAESRPVTNLIDQDMCFCGENVSLIVESKETTLLCRHCNKRYHQDCMKRPANDEMCTFCHLKKLIPNRETKKVLFVGLLYKGRKKHEISLPLIQGDVSLQHRIQVRCFRIHQDCQKSMLFPDSSNIALNGNSIKTFKPLKRGSSLKYRKDEAFYLPPTHMSVSDNKVLVTEEHSSQSTLDDKIDLEHHLIGIYLIKQKSVKSLVQQRRMNGLTTFNESKEMIDNFFARGLTGEEVTCEMIKVPLTCSLTALKITMPARGIFCTHYQCFDLSNFLLLTTASLTPQWMCPLCKKPASEFRIDSILLSLLEQLKEVDIVEVMFLAGGELKVYLPDSKELNSKITSIYDLPVDDKLKRAPPKSQGKDVPKKKVITKIVID